MTETATTHAPGITTDELDLLDRMLDEAGVEEPLSTRAIVPREDPADRPLSFTQRRLWFLDQWQPGSPAYNLYGALRLVGELDTGAMSRALDEIVRRHEILRIRFPTVGGEPVQVVIDDAPPSLSMTDLRALDPEERESAARELARADAAAPFDLSEGPLLRAGLARLDDDEHLFHVTAHHMVADGGSVGQILQELADLYGAYRRGEASPLTAPRLQFADYADWERRNLQGEILDDLLSHWTERLHGAPPVLDLPLDRPRPPVMDDAGSRETAVVGADTTAALRALCRRRKVTLFTALLGAFGVLLRRMSGELDLVVGTPIAHRSRPEVEDLVGPVLNTLALRLDLSGDPTLAEVVDRCAAVVDDAHAHQDLPFERLVESLSEERDLAHSPVFQTMLVLQNARRRGIELPGLDVEPLDVYAPVALFDLLLTVVEAGETLELTFEYRSRLFHATTVRRSLARYRLLLGLLAERPETRLGDLTDLLPGERQALLYEWGAGPGGEAPTARRTLHERFAEVARARPDAVALMDGERQVSYGELARRASAGAGRLRAAGAEPGELVGLCLERSLETVVGILSILEAGCAYLPLDPSYPGERLRLMVEDSGVRSVVGEPDAVPATILEGVRLVPVASEDPGEAPAGRPAAIPDQALAYVIYTSGSTGRPKGVEVTHRNVSRLLDQTRPSIPAGPDDTWSFFHSFAFDMSVWEIWGALLRGGRVVVLSRLATRSPDRTLDLLRDRRVTVLSQTPSAFRQMVAGEAEREPSGALSIRWVTFGGEALDPASLGPWAERHGADALVNLYGITETTVHVTIWPVVPAAAGTWRGSPVGYAIPDLRTYLLDPASRPVPAGASGEIVVGGEGVARGYLKRPALTAERFVPDPYGGEPGARLYRSGDRARHLPDGGLEFLGRLDHQVKVRGFRIELGEIEAFLAEHPGVGAAAATTHGDGSDRRLAAYVVPANGDAPSTADLRSWLQDRLPDHSVPAAFVELPELPVTPSGKLDRAALPALGDTRPDVGVGFVAPEGPTEQALAEAWSDALDLDRVGVLDGFFALGGDSIRTVRAAALAAERDLDVSIQDIFRYETVRRLARALDRGETDAGGERLETTEPFSLVSEEDRRRMPPGVVDAYPLVSMQSGMLYHLGLDPEAAPYHNVDSSHLRMPFDREALQTAVDRAVARHPVLRTAFHTDDFSEPLQLVHGEARLEVGVDDLRDLEPAERERRVEEYRSKELHRFFDLTRPPLFRVHVHRRTDETVQLTITECHPIFDGWSLTSTLAEIFDEYLSRVAGETPPRRPDPAFDFRDYVALERRTVESPEHRDFWRGQLDGWTRMELPRWPDRVEPEPGKAIRRRVVPIEEPVIAGLRAVARRLGVPVKSTLLASHLEALGLATGRREIRTGLSVNGRPDVPGGDQVRGIFINTVPLRFDLGGAGTWEELVRRAFEAERRILPHRRYPIAALQREHGAGELYETVFNFTNFRSLTGLMENRGLEVLDYRWSQDTHFPYLANYSLYPDDSRLELILAYDGAELTERQIDWIAERYRSVCAAIAEHPAAPRSASSFLTPAERAIAGSGPDEAAPAAEAPGENATLDRWVAARVKERPDAPALVDGERAVDRAALDRRADRIARRLRARSVARGDRVGVLLRRSPELVASVLGVLRAGAAFVPLEPEHPRGRLELVAREAGLSLVVTDAELAGRLVDADGSAGPIEALRVDDDKAGEPSGHPVEPVTGPDDVAYVIFTSGSTGVPKGVPIRHRSVMRYLAWAWRAYGAGEALTLPLHSSVAFDLTLTSLFLPLVSGGRIVIHRDTGTEAVAAVLADDRSDVVKLTPSHLAVALGEDAECGPRRLVLGGEALEGSLVRRARKAWGDDMELCNEYGPTEATVGCVMYRVEPGVRVPDRVPIGRPVAGARVHVLDELDRPAMVGAPGELCIAGDGLATGYLNRPRQTAGRFTPDPFTADARMYRTGDRARWLPSGELEFLGRENDQVKLRGHRLELGEVRAAVESHPGVREALPRLAAGPGGEPSLVVYYTADGPLGSAALREHAERTLVPETVPSRFVHLDAIPVTVGGKVDFDALPSPDEVAEEEAPGAPPRTQTEEVIASIWSQVLGIDRVSRDDDFIGLGGHSLVAIQAVSRLRKVFRVDLGLRSVLDADDLAALAVEIESSRAVGDEDRQPPLEPMEADGPAPVSFAQRRLWLVDRMDPGTPAYNLPGAIHLRGDLDAHAWARSLSRIARRHETLRTTFEAVEDEPVQRIHPPAPVPLPVIDLGGLPESRRDQETDRLVTAEAIRGFDLTRGPLLRTRLLRLAPREHVFTLTLHHIVCDGWSTGILVEELASLYRAELEGRAAGLPEPAIQYRDFAAWQRRWLRDEALDRQLEFWRRRFDEAPPPVRLPTDTAPPATRSFRGAFERLEVEADVLSGLKRLSAEENATLFITLFAAFNALLYRYSGQEDLTVGTGVAGRDRAETEDLIGFFVNTLALRTDLSGNPTFRELLGRVRETVLDAFMHQELPFEKLVSELQPERSASHTPLFNVIFGLQNVPERSLELPGLDAEPVESPERIAKFDLLMALVERDDLLVAGIEYPTELFEAATVAGMLDHYAGLLRSVVADPDAHLLDLAVGETAEEEAAPAGETAAKFSFEGLGDE